MNKFSFFLITLIGLLVTSCIPTKDLIYLQNKNNSEQPQVVNPINAKPYRVQVNDVLSVSVKTVDPKLSQLFSITNEAMVNKSDLGLYYDGFTIDDHGNIRIPLLGEMNVLGFTTDEIRKTIEDKLLKEYFNKEANLFVNVKLAGFRYTINGEITAPGTRTLFQDKVNIMEAIANSGDITVTGNRKEVTIIRQFPQGTEMKIIDLTDINAMQSPYYFLQPNDYIYIKPLKQKTWGTGKTGIESLSSIITILSLVTTTFLLLKK